MRDRYISPENSPEGRERELLTILMEECAEVQQRASKALRFGTQEVQPGQAKNNVERLAVEIGDLQALIDILCVEEIVDTDLVMTAAAAKYRKLPKWLQSRHIGGR